MSILLANGTQLPIAKPMAGFRRGDVVQVPFTYTVRFARQSRPALVYSSPALEDQHDSLRVLMIIRTDYRGWPVDAPIDDLDGTGLPVTSVIRTAKIAAIETINACKLGELPATIRKKIIKLLERQPDIE